MITHSQKKLINLSQYGFPFGALNHFNDALTKEFIQLYSDSKHGLSKSFSSESEKVFFQFDPKYIRQLSDDYFNNFIVIHNYLLAKERFHEAFILWQEILHLSKVIEEKSKLKLHKGTPYYFASVTAIYNNNIDAALISMHLAHLEDQNNHADPFSKPAYLFLTLDEDPKQNFRTFVQFMAGFVKDRLDNTGNTKNNKNNYKDSRSGNLTYVELQTKFLKNKSISLETKYFFVFSILRMWHMRQLKKSYIEDSVITPTIFSQVISGFIIITESLLRKKFGTGPKETYHTFFQRLMKQESWDSPVNLKIMQSTNDSRNSNFNTWIDNHLKKDSIFDDFCIVYGLRNAILHDVSSQKIMWDRHTELFQSTMNCFFKLVEIM